MSVKHRDIIETTADYIRQKLRDAEPGHDWWHTSRVRHWARHLQEREGGDLELIELAALLHDLQDYKFQDGDTEAGPNAAIHWLVAQGYPENRAKSVANIVASINFKGPSGKEHAESIEHAVVQDADRIDALGAIGVARAFSYGGHFARKMLDPAIPPRINMGASEYQKSKSPTINHFFEKLLLLKDRMFTRTGKMLASELHSFLIRFLTQFFDEFFFGNPPPEDWAKLLREYQSGSRPVSSEESEVSKERCGK
jgi:uncharacterized protein